MRLSPQGFLKISQAQSFDAYLAGSEYNVVTSLARYGLNVGLATILPENALGDRALKELKSNDVHTSHIKRGGDRIGTYYLENGSSIRNSKVIYDRCGTSMSEIKPGTIDWDEVLEGVKIFHWSGITPAISESAALVCKEALEAARAKKITISTDLNYRSKLWNYGKECHEVMSELLPYCQIILGDIDTACMMLGIPPEEPDYFNELPLKRAYDVIFEELPQLELMATTLRMRESASQHRISGVIYCDNQINSAKVYHINPIVDRVGSGDAFMAGLLYGYVNFGSDYQRIVDYATAACAIKHTIHGDVNLTNKDEVYDLMSGQSSGSISR